MKSTGGAHYIGLDHLRALAAFMVFRWHFAQTTNGIGFPVSFD
jgi:peptidoglycan/LPS O-acetylase OafA/YrhL